jgi:hypothetical protein
MSLLVLIQRSIGGLTLTDMMGHVCCVYLISRLACLVIGGQLEAQETLVPEKCCKPFLNLT